MENGSFDVSSVGRLTRTRVGSLATRLFVNGKVGGASDGARTARSSKTILKGSSGIVLREGVVVPNRKVGHNH